MRRIGLGLVAVSLLSATLVAAMSLGDGTANTGEALQEPIPLKEAKLNIEHNATDNDTGFQGFVDSEGWKRLDVRGPDGTLLTLEGRGELGELGLTELFFESVEPENAEVPLDELLETLPEGEYAFVGQGMENGERTGRTTGTAVLTHDIPAGPVLLSPAPNATVSATGLTANWGAVTKTITGDPVTIVAYQLIIETDQPPHPNFIGKIGLSIYVPATVTSIAIPDGVLAPGTAYKWEVLAIEESGNQTLSSGEFQTQ